MPELRRSFAMSHLPFSYETGGEFIVPFVLGETDKSGDNIADRPAFSETRGHYWLWRNDDFAGEFVSIQQYRRCFWFPHLLISDSPFRCHSGELAKNLGQQILHMSRADYIAYVREIDAADKTPLNGWLSGVDVVVGRAIEYPRTIAQIYGEHHRPQDWEIFASVCRRRGYDDGRHPWLTGHLMFIMRPQIFDQYMTEWWAIMQEVDALIEHNDDPYQHRAIGYLSERFLSAWLVRTRVERPTICIQSLPIVEGLFQFDRTAPGVM